MHTRTSLSYRDIIIGASRSEPHTIITHMRKSLYLYMYVCIYVCMYVCMYVAIHRPRVHHALCTCTY